MKKQPNKTKSPAYYVFYLLFSTDCWRILMGAVLSLLATPHLAPADFSPAARAMLHVMVAAIGWAASAAPGRWIVQALKKAILGDSRRS